MRGMSALKPELSLALWTFIGEPGRAQREAGGLLRHPRQMTGWWAEGAPSGAALCGLGRAASSRSVILPGSRGREAVQRRKERVCPAGDIG